MHEREGTYTFAVLPCATAPLETATQVQDTKQARLHRTYTCTSVHMTVHVYVNTHTNTHLRDPPYMYMHKKLMMLSYSFFLPSKSSYIHVRTCKINCMHVHVNCMHIVHQTPLLTLCLAPMPPPTPHTPIIVFIAPPLLLHMPEHTKYDQ